MFVRYAGRMTEPGQVGKFLDGDFIRDLEAELKIRRHLRGQPFQIFVRWKRVVCRVHADRLEHLGIFAQAVPLKPRLGDFALTLVARRRVKLPEPAVMLSNWTYR